MWLSSLFSVVLGLLWFLLRTYLTEVHLLIRERASDSDLLHRMAHRHVWGLLLIIRFLSRLH